MDKSIFLDTSFVLAYLFRDDTFNAKALKLQNTILKEGLNILTTDLILIEIGNSLSKIGLRHEAVITVKTLKKIAIVLAVDKDILQSS